MSNMPYVGLRPFNRDETDIFFGRESYTDELLALLGQHHFIAVVGDSGCGKSSLVRTGLEAGLQAGLLSQAGSQWRIAEMRPGSAPFANLSESLLDKDALGDDFLKYFADENTAKEALQQALTQGSLSLHQLLQSYPLPKQHKLLLVCDQFEEIFRFDNHTEAAAFVNLLLGSSKPYPLGNGLLSNSVYVVITMRSEYMGKCALFSGLAQAVNQGIYLLPRLTRQQLREAIEEPAFVFGGSIEPALVERLLEDAENNPDQLPLLQHVLMRLWELAEENHSTDLTLELYQNEKIGGLQQALSIYADRTYHSFSPEQQHIAEVLFRNLAVIDETGQQDDIRKPVRLGDVAELANVSWEEVAQVVEFFRHDLCCFLRPPLPIELNQDSMIDISHESLIRNWQRLKEWLQDEANSLLNYRRLRERALFHKEKKAGCLIEPELSIYWQWYKQKQPNELWAQRHSGDFAITQKFLLKSRRRHYWRRFSIVSFILLVVGGSVIGYQYQREQTEKIELANQKLQQAKDDIEKRKNEIEQEKVKALQALDMLYKMREAFFTKENSPILEEKFAELVKKDPKNSDAWIYYGQALQFQNKLDQAEQAFIKATEANPQSSWAWDSLASMFYTKNKTDKVIKIFHQAIILNPKESWPWVKLAIELAHANKFEEAENALRQAIKLNPKDVRAWSELGFTLMVLNKPDESIKAYQKLVEIAPKESWSWIKFVNALIRANKVDDGIKAYQKAIKINPNNGDLWHELASIFLDKKQFDDAITVYKKAINVKLKDNSDYIIWNNLINLLLNKGKFDDAIKIYIQSLKTSTNDSLFYIGTELSSFLIKSNKLKQAELVLLETLNKFPNALFVLETDLRLAMVQNDKQRLQKRLKTIQPLLKPNEQYHAIILFLTFIAEPEKGWQAVITAIEKTEKDVKFTWDFSNLEPAIQRQDKKTQQQIRLFIDYFNAKIDLATLKQQLKATEQTP